jgi:hypothetical protein
VTAIAGGGFHSLALKSDGTIWVWGNNASGELGNGTKVTNSTVPVQVSGLSGVNSIAGARSHNLAVKSDGTAWAWGYNYYGQLGNGKNGESNVPVQVNALTGVRIVAGGFAHSLAATTMVPAGSAAPKTVSVSPAAGTGLTSTVTFTFSDPDGSQDLDVVNVLIRDFLDGRSACYLAYVRSLNVLYLVNDAGTALLPELALGGAGSVGNSQCTITAAGSSALGSGNTLTLALRMTFSPAFAGNKIIYLAARDVAQNNSGWQALGTWIVPGAPATVTAAGAVTPAHGNGSTQTFTFTFTDTTGWQDLGVVNVLINDFLDGRNACYIAYSRPDNVLYLVNDPGTALLPAMVMNGSGSVGNSQCVVNGAASTATGNGNTLTLTLHLSFPPVFSGNRVIYLAARDITGANNSGWHALGTWRVP